MGRTHNSQGHHLISNMKTLYEVSGGFGTRANLGICLGIKIIIDFNKIHSQWLVVTKQSPLFTGEQDDAIAIL